MKANGILALATLLLPLAAGAQEEAPPARRDAPPAQGEAPPAQQAPARAQLGQVPEPLELADTPEGEIPDYGAPVLTLEEVLAKAERPDGNLDLVQLREQLEQANNEVRRAWSNLLPQVNAAATYTRQSHEAVIQFPNFAAGFQTLPDGTLVPTEVMDLEVQKRDQFAAVAEVAFPVLAMPAYFGIAAANRGVEATEKQITFARNEVILAISQAYYGAVASRRLIEVAYRQVRAQHEQERVAQARYEVGEVPKVGWLRAAVARSQAEQDLVRAKNAYASTKHTIAQLTGVSEPFDVVAPAPVKAPEGSEDDLIRVGLQNRKDLQAARAQEELADRLVKSAWWEFAPIVSAQGQYLWANVAGFTGSNESWNVQLVASLNIFDGFRRYANLDDARSRRRQAEASRQSLAREVIRDVKTTLLDLESARANLTKARAQAELAAENADLVRSQYDAGVATYLDVTDALNARFAAEVGVVTEELNVQVASLRLSRAIGRFGVEKFP